MDATINFLLHLMRAHWMKLLIWVLKDAALIATYIFTAMAAKYIWRAGKARILIFAQILSLALNIAWELHYPIIHDWRGGDAITLGITVLSFAGIICILQWPIVLAYILTGMTWFTEYYLAETGFESDRRAANALYLIRCWAQIVCYAWTALAIYLWREEKRMSDCEKKPKEPKKPKPKPVPLGGPKTAEPPPDGDPH